MKKWLLVSLSLALFFFLVSFLYIFYRENTEKKRSVTQKVTSPSQKNKAVHRLVLSSTTRKKATHIWNAQKVKPIHTFYAHDLLGVNWIRKVFFTQDGKQILSAGRDKTVKMWDVKTKQLIFNFHVKTPVGDLSVHPKGHMFAIAQHIGSILQLWDMRTKKRIHVWKGDRKDVRSVLFHPNGRLLASIGKGRKIRIWDIVKKKEVFSLSKFAKGEDSMGFDGAIAFHPKGMLLANAFNDNIQIWDFKRRRKLYTINSHGHAVFSLCFHPSANLIVSGGFDKTTKLWDFKEQKLLHTFKGYTSRVVFAKFLQKGRFIVTVTHAGHIHVWNTKTKKLVHVFRTSLYHKGDLLKPITYFIDFQRGGTFFVTSGSTPRFMLWQFE